MSLANDIDTTHAELRQALQHVVEAQFRVVQIAAQGNLAFIAALEALARTIAAPRYLTHDAEGNLVGVSSPPPQQSQ